MNARASSDPFDNPGYEIEVIATEPRNEIREGARLVRVVVEDPVTYRGVAATFEYLSVPGIPVLPIGFALGQGKDRPRDNPYEIVPGLARTIRLSGWETAARIYVDMWVAREAGGPEQLPAYANNAQLAEQHVRMAYPDLNPQGTKAEIRRYKSLTHLAEIHLDYRALKFSGIKDPTGVIAKQRNVKPATVRSWLHRARQTVFSYGEAKEDE